MTDTQLKDKKCEPCEGKTDPFTKEQAEEYLAKTPGWQLSEDGNKIYREYKTKNFVEAVKFIQKIADVAEGEDHHPDVHLTGYNNLYVDLMTHAIGGLSENDFIVAAKINELEVELK